MNFDFQIYSLVSLEAANDTAQKMNFSIRNFFCKCDQFRSFLRIRSYLLKKSLMENLIFCAVSQCSLVSTVLKA